VLDWVEGWSLTGKGRIYKVSDPARRQDPKVAEVKRLLAEGMAKRPEQELARLLGHADQRVRQEAQFALATRKEGGKALLRVAKEGKERLARLHALWGLGQLALKTDRPAEAVEPFLKDRDAEVRAQAAKVLGWRRVTPAGAFKGLDLRTEGELMAIHQAWGRAAVKLAPLLEADSPRVRFLAAL